MRRGFLLGRVVLAFLMTGIMMVACGEDITGIPDGAAVFELEVSGEVFRVAVSDTADIRQFESRMQNGTRGVVSGQLRTGAGGVNSPWGWHLDPASVHVADMAIELCDGRPSMVQADLDYWIGTVKQYCPWGARVVARRQ
jgi:creatinine amidohydrolase/Fe(II)-dependent formamide hydrolase-like protein